jgi:isoamylase
MGTPMLLMGDEVRRTQQGNNNAYCQDNEISWFDWTLLERYDDVFHFARQLIHLRQRFQRVDEERAMSLAQVLQQAKIDWHGVKLNQPDWGRDSHSLALTFEYREGTRLTHFILNAYWEPLEFELPPVPGDLGVGWRRLIDTFLPSPQDFCAPAEAPLVDGTSYHVGPRSVVVLVAGQ